MLPLSWLTFIGILWYYFFFSRISFWSGLFTCVVNTEERRNSNTIAVKMFQRRYFYTLHFVWTWFIFIQLMTIACGVLNYNLKKIYNELKMIFISLLFLSITNIPGDHMGSRPQVWPQNLISKKKKLLFHSSMQTVTKTENPFNSKHSVITDTNFYPLFYYRSRVILLLYSIV